MTPEERLAELETENATLRTQLATPLAELQPMHGQLGKDSHNSSKPPASDGLARKTRSLSQPSGKRPDGQPGHRGATFALVETPDQVIRHRPRVCAQCQTPLVDVAAAPRARRPCARPRVIQAIHRPRRRLRVSPSRRQTG